jgi:redox-sensitive bicupin YhaK (pirin superfamily)
MITLRKSEERGQADHGWLLARHSFSFAEYHDPRHMGFRSLRVINEDRVAGGGGFGMHPHRDMEIVTYILAGALRHRDSLGNTAVMRPGDVQRISAGRGVLHSEHNESPSETVHLLQIWLRPARPGVEPRYDERSFADTPPGVPRLLVSGDGREQSLPIHQDADLWLLRWTGGERLIHRFRPGRGGWVQVTRGTVRVAGQELSAGDAVALEAEPEIELVADRAAEVLLFDLA